MEENIKDFIDILTLTQDSLNDYLLERISRSDKYNIEISKGGFLVTPKNCDMYPLICAHLDTINDSCSILAPTIDDLKFIGSDYIALKDTSQKACLGGDDRCGVYIALKLIELGLPYSFGFFYDEEKGGVGSSLMSKSINKMDNITCYIGLDRRGFDQLALYGYDNEKLINIFERFGYFRDRGSFTDASNLSKNCLKGLACVNLSVGYYNEHTKKEILNTTAMNHTLKVLKNLDISLFNKPFKAEFNKPLFRGTSYGLVGDMWESDHMLENEIWEAGEVDDYNAMLENAYIDGYNYALELGYSEAIKEYRDMSCKGDDEYMAYFNGFGDALDDMENFKE
ncbi:hypothetical protein [Campylobacter hyointestinalis]|uniref:hypothetical protein n=1 Tax=Campylobacter hyointestinalis TaxID=198 RepID=UPI00255354C9|nr:hypothetical protein [Campylobacter hyointestinalis]MDL2347670.1 hypothetical protein [Campylobacter hyointestinalis]MDL2349413.1 hypothetical protein [Campylobacter hyointestinalis]MDL2351160.1 hypothetical protein [Campylobacter hyointestinalis]MDM1026990.1 hypothetical protein [Campylobacter hyointestinalis]MDM1028748.1 hypothetical protein [Campylobacter hyointestinalis]